MQRRGHGRENQLTDPSRKQLRAKFCPSLTAFFFFNFKKIIIFCPSCASFTLSLFFFSILFPDILFCFFHSFCSVIQPAYFLLFAPRHVHNLSMELPLLPLLCLGVFKQYSTVGAADAGTEVGSIHCPISVLAFSFVLYLCCAVFPVLDSFLCCLKVKTGRWQGVSWDCTTRVCNCCCLLYLLKLRCPFTPDFIPGCELGKQCRCLGCTKKRCLPKQMKCARF